MKGPWVLSANQWERTREGWMGHCSVTTDGGRAVAVATDARRTYTDVMLEIEILVALRSATASTDGRRIAVDLIDRRLSELEEMATQ